MPIEIRELIIKATVDNQTSGASSGPSSEEGSNETNINEIAERVFAILKEKSER